MISVVIIYLVMASVFAIILSVLNATKTLRCSKNERAWCSFFFPITLIVVLFGIVIYVFSELPDFVIDKMKTKHRTYRIRKTKEKEDKTPKLVKVRGEPKGNPFRGEPVIDEVDMKQVVSGDE